MRRLWREYGKQSLNSVACLFDVQEKNIYHWLNCLMKEVSLLDRNLYEDYIADIMLPYSRLQEIENTESSIASTENYSINPLAYLFFSKGLGSVRLVQEWHKKLYDSESLDSFLDSLADKLYDWQNNEYLNFNSAFCNP